MSTASSAAVVTASAVARILLFICCGQLMVNIGSTVEANESVENQSSEGRVLNAGYKEYPGKYWTDSDCSDKGQLYTGLELKTCKAICTGHDKCTAFYFSTGSGSCQLVYCPPQVPEPTGTSAVRTGYAIIQDIKVESECKNLHGEIFHEKCYFFSEPHVTETYDAAQEACIAKHGELAMFADNSEDGLHIVELRNTGDPRYWVGGRDIDTEGGWQWENGELINWPFGHHPWGHDEPNNVGHEKCLDILTTQGGDHHGYNDEYCEMEHQYICEIGCYFGGTIYPPGSFIHEACAQLQCNGTTGLFDNLGYDDHCPSCMAYWDPHILTYDHSCNLVSSSISHGRCWSQSYSYQKCGNYSLTQVGNSTKPSYAVYSTFVTCGGGFSSYTCVDAVTFKNDNHTIVNIVFQESVLKITANGEDVSSDALSSSPSIVKVNDIEYPILAWASNYFNAGRQTSCVSLQGSSGILVRYCGDSSNKANTVGVWANPDISDRLKGLCGTANDNQQDDFTTRDGSKTWVFTYRPPEAFPLSWLADSNNADGNCGGSRKQSETICETNTTLSEIFQSQCEDAVLNGFLNAESNLSQILINDCVYDLCHVSDAEQWMGSVHGAMPIHTEIKEKTAGHCKHKRTHKCKTHKGHCILKTETCNGTIIDNGCHGKKCECCAPSGCVHSPKCLKKQGKCLLLKDAMNCDGIVNSKLCSGNKCACCYPQAQKKCGKSEKCSKVNGECIRIWNWKNCDGKLKKGWCEGKKCGCCYP